MSLTVTHIDHCSVIVTDVAASRRFYGELLGLKEIPAPKTFDFVALWFDLGGTYLHLLLKPSARDTSVCKCRTSLRRGPTSPPKEFRLKRRSRSPAPSDSSSATRTEIGSRFCNGSRDTIRRLMADTAFSGLVRSK